MRACYRTDNVIICRNGSQRRNAIPRNNLCIWMHPYLGNPHDITTDWTHLNAFPQNCEPDAGHSQTGTHITHIHLEPTTFAWLPLFSFLQNLSCESPLFGSMHLRTCALSAYQTPNLVWNNEHLEACIMTHGNN